MRWLHSPLAVAPMLMGMFFAGTCAAQVDSTTDSDWFQSHATRPTGMAPAAGPIARPANNAGGRDFGQPPPAPVPPGDTPAYPSDQSDFPTDAVQNWVVASARVAHYRALLHLTESNLDRIVRDIQSSFEQSREYQDAVAAETQAYDAYNAERRNALQSVVNDPKYQAVIQLRDQLAEKLARLRAAGKSVQIPYEQILAVASQKLEYASRAHAMEQAVLEQSPAVQQARQRLVQAGSRVSGLQAQFDSALRTNPQALQVRRNLDEIRVALITAETYADAARTAAALATDYSYYRHRWEGLAAPVITWGPYGWGY